MEIWESLLTMLEILIGLFIIEWPSKQVSFITFWIVSPTILHDINVFGIPVVSSRFYNIT